MWRTVWVAGVFLVVIAGTMAMHAWSAAPLKLLTSSSANVRAVIAEPVIDHEVNSLTKGDKLIVAPLLPTMPATAQPPELVSAIEDRAPSVPSRPKIISRHWHEPNVLVLSDKASTSHTAKHRQTR